MYNLTAPNQPHKQYCVFQGNSYELIMVRQLLRAEKIRGREIWYGEV